jgi:hypothetical protein
MTSLKVHVSVNQEEYPELYALIEGCRSGRAASRKVKDAAQNWLVLADKGSPRPIFTVPEVVAAAMLGRQGITYGSDLADRQVAASERPIIPEEFGDSIADSFLKNL